MKSQKIIRIFWLGVIATSLYYCKTEEIILHGEISGLVTDTTTNQPLQAIPVILNPLNDTTKTGIDGKYLFKSLVPGDYQVKVSKIPYATTIQNVKVTSATSTEVDFHLHIIAHAEISMKYLDFGLDSTRSFFTIKNKGTGNLHYTLTTSQNWIKVNSEVGNITTGFDTIKVTIDRTGLSTKKHIESIEIASKIENDYIKDYVKVFVNGVMDADNNYYSVVTIDTQTWMQENLNVGKQISSGLDQTNNRIIEKYYYNNDVEFGKIYGGMYQWKEAMNYAPSDTGIIGTTQGICPLGWHISTKNEFDTLLLSGANLHDINGFAALYGGWYEYGTFNEGGLIGTGFTYIYSSTIINNIPVLLLVGLNLIISMPDEHAACYIRCIKDPPKK